MKFDIGIILLFFTPENIHNFIYLGDNQIASKCLFLCRETIKESRMDGADRRFVHYFLHACVLRRQKLDINRITT